MFSILFAALPGKNPALPLFWVNRMMPDLKRVFDLFVPTVGVFLAAAAGIYLAYLVYRYFKDSTRL